jgi:hypothetical protein
MARAANDRVKLLHGPCKTPRLRRGDRAFCLFRDCDVVVTDFLRVRRCHPPPPAAPVTRAGGHVRLATCSRLAKRTC